MIFFVTNNEKFLVCGEQKQLHLEKKKVRMRAINKTTYGIKIMNFKEFSVKSEIFTEFFKTSVSSFESKLILKHLSLTFLRAILFHYWQWVSINRLRGLLIYKRNSNISSPSEK